MSPLVERVVKVLPQEHFTSVTTYFGWMSAFIGSRSLRDAASCHSGGRGLGDLGQELVIGLEGAHAVDQQLEAGAVASVAATLAPAEPGQDPAQLPDHVELSSREQQLLVPGRGGVHVDRR